MRAARQHGFTLMELIITMVIIGILTAIAIPNYTAYIIRSNRAEARGQLLEMSTWMERWRTERGRYDNPASAGNPPPTPPFPATGRNLHQRLRQQSTRLPSPLRPRSATPSQRRRLASWRVMYVATWWLTRPVSVLFTGGGGTQDVCWNR